MSSDPSHEELREFVRSMLANLDKSLREDDVIDEAIADHREMWTRLYRAASDLDAHDGSS